jgi:hypothetical protein
MKMIHNSAVLVRRTSHCHHTPQALRAHSGPVIRAHSPKTTASSAAETDSSSAFSEPRNRYSALHTPAVRALIMASHAQGT